MHELAANPWVYGIYINISLLAVISAAFLGRRRLLWISIILSFAFGILSLFLKAYWQPVVLGFIVILLCPLMVTMVKDSFDRYKKILQEESLRAQSEYNELVSNEGIIYDNQLKYNDKLTQVSSLYEITKDMSTSLRFSDIFNMLAGYIHKTFLFKKLKLVLINAEDDGSSGNIAYEAKGVTDSSLKVKGIFPKLEVSSRQLDDHDKKLYDILRGDIRRLQIVKSQWKENPYIEFLPEGAETYVAIPMIIDNQPIGILAIEDLPTSDFEKFSILAAQFILEMRRITLYEKVEEMAITDGLSKAFAKRHITERLQEEFERSVRHNFNLSFVMIDIDYFKRYNDTYGHLVGDIVLRDMVTLLKGNTREVDLVGRFGGEEFCLVLPETKKEEAQLVSERIREMVEKHKFKAYDELTNVTVSIGIATYPQDCADVDALTENSDKALYQAKNTGRNKVCLFKP